MVTPQTTPLPPYRALHPPQQFQLVPGLAVTPHNVAPAELLIFEGETESRGRRVRAGSVAENVLTRPPVLTLLRMFRRARNVNSPLLQICAIISLRMSFPKCYGFISCIQLVKSCGKSKKRRQSRHSKQQFSVTRKEVGHEKVFIIVAKFFLANMFRPQQVLLLQGFKPAHRKQIGHEIQCIFKTD